MAVNAQTNLVSVVLAFLGELSSAENQLTVGYTEMVIKV